jgi:hypothetical protein
MKKIIIMCAGIFLGIQIYGWILGDDPSSLKKASSDLMQQQLKEAKARP